MGLRKFLCWQLGAAGQGCWVQLVSPVGAHDCHGSTIGVFGVLGLAGGTLHDSRGQEGQGCSSHSPPRISLAASQAATAPLSGGNLLATVSCRQEEHL